PRPRLAAVMLPIAWAFAGPAAAISPILQFDFTNGSPANTGTGSQVAAAIAPGSVVASGGLDGTGSYQNHDTPANGTNYQYQSGRFAGSGLDNELRSITVTMWL